MKQAHILVVEDEDVTRFNLVQLFIAEGYTVSEAIDGESMHDALQSNTIQLVVMDINLPGTNGLILAKELISKQDIALIFLTGRDADIDKVLGLEIGADDYITKPFNPRELTIRVRNILNRLQEKPSSSNAENLFSFNEWKLDGNARVMTSPTGQSFSIPRGEYRALTLLIENAGNIVSRKELLFAMTGRDLKAQDRTVDVTIRRLRKHFESVENSPELIHTIHGEGYRFVGTLD